MTNKPTNDTPESSLSAEKKPGRRKYNVSPEEFVTAWETSETPLEVATKLNMPKPIVLARASSYRAVGVRLNKMTRKRVDSLDIAGLNNLIAKLPREPTQGK